MLFLPHVMDTAATIVDVESSLLLHAVSISIATEIIQNNFFICIYLFYCFT